MVVVAHGRPGHSQSLRSVISFPSSSKIALDTEAHGVVGVHAHVRDLAATSASLEFVWFPQTFRDGVDTI